MRRSFLIVVCLCLATMATAQEPYLLFDLNSTPDGSFPATPESMVELGDQVFFTAFVPDAGREPWITDGTPSGTRPLADVVPGPGYGNTTVLAVLGGKVFFTTFAEGELELWMSDGRVAGTTPLHRVRWSRFFSSEPTYAPLDDRLVLAVESGDDRSALLGIDANGTVTELVELDEIASPVRFGDSVVFFDRGLDPGLWRSDGTPEGTEPVFKGEIGLSQALAAAEGRVFFFASSDLWTSDGSAQGTKRLFRFSSASRIFPQGAEVYFVADDGVHGNELWTSDGTVSGTRPITDFAEPFRFSTLGARSLGEVGGRIVFPGYETDPTELRWWSAKDSPESVERLTQARAVGRGPMELHVSGDRAYFLANDGVHGQEVWVTDGTAAGTGMVLDVCPGDCFGEAYELRAGLEGAVFVAREGHGRPELWTTDGTAAGTRPFTAFDSTFALPDGSHEPDDDWLTALDERVYFAAAQIRGSELWTSDGTLAGTRRLTGISGPRNPDSVSVGSRFAALGDRLIFSACDGETGGLYVLSRPAASPTSLARFDGRACTAGPSEPSEVGGRLVYVLQGHPDELWASDGTAAGTVLLDLASFIRELVPHEGELLFSRETDSGSEIWTTDGTPTGTRPLAAAADLGIARMNRPHALDDQIVFYERLDASSGYRVRVSDLTPAGTEVLGEFRNLGFGGLEFEAAAVGSRIYFTGDGELWTSDGTAAGTEMIAVDAVPSLFPWPSDLTPFGNELLFFSDTDHGRRDLFRADGSGTATRLHAFARDDGDSFPDAQMTRLGESVYFVADDGVHGRELWRTDGTADSTKIVVDLFPGRWSSRIEELTTAGGWLYFTATDGASGLELWRSDGTASGTVRVGDVLPGPFGSRPTHLTRVGDVLYFSATDGVHGREPWAVPLATPPGCRPDAVTLCLGGGRFQATMTWRDFDGNEGRGRAAPLSDDTGSFWFFDEENLETVVKVLDGRSLNDHFWVFYASLSNVGFSLTVVDTETGATVSYENAPGAFASVGDVEALPAAGTGAVAEPVKAFAKGGASGCGPETLCLGGGRFRLEVEWTDFDGDTGRGTAEALTTDTGYFWFFDDANVELVVKVLDGRDFNDYFWVFYGALSNVAFRLTVTDLETGAVKVYENPLGTFASVGDVRALSGSP